MELLDLPQKALAVRQPWAWAIIHAGKDVENRGWRTSCRGDVCIHASQALRPAELSAYSATTNDVEAWHAHKAISTKEARKDPVRAELLRPSVSQLALGGIIGVVEIVDVVEDSQSPWFFGQYGWVLRNPRPVPFIPLKGALGMFDWRAKLDHIS